MDTKDGLAPNPHSLDRLIEIASKYGDRPASWIPIDDAMATLHWNGLDTISCDGKLDSGITYVLVRYAGKEIEGFGLSANVPSDSSCGRKLLPVILVSQDRLARHRVLWLTRQKLETRTLLHEYGHLLGLGSNPAHAYYPRYPDIDGGPHCRNPNCAMALPLPRAITYGIYRTGLTFRNVRDFCKQCQEDIAWSKEYWLTGRESPISVPLAHDHGRLERWLMRLDVSEFTDGGEAVSAVAYGKAAVPGLMKRMRTLPDGSPSSPRIGAQTLIQNILIAEARHKGTSAGDVLWFAGGDHHAALETWWEVEQEAFMTGDNWTLPEGVVRTAPLPADSSYP